MGDRIAIHPVNPQPRMIARAVDAVQRGALLVAPSDAGYLLLWAVDALKAEERVQRMRGLDSKHPFTFILPVSSELPRRFKQAKRKVIGCRIPDSSVLLALIRDCGTPLLSTSIEFDEDSPDRQDPEDVADRVLRDVDLMLDAGECAAGPTSVVDLSGDVPCVVRQGAVPVVF